MVTFSPRVVKNTLAATTLALSAFSLNAHATLTSFTNQGADLVYSSVSNVTWTKDANLFNAMATSDPNFYQTMRTIAASNNLTSGSSCGGIGCSATDWSTAKVFTLYLNSINYGGSNQWRLPTAANTSSTNTTGNGTTAGDEFVELFYQELNGTANSSIPNTAFFDNEQSETYWTGTEINALNAHSFSTLRGRPSGRGEAKSNNRYAWAVTTGDLRTSAVSAVPVPAAAWLFGSGLIGLAGLRRRKQAV